MKLYLPGIAVSQIHIYADAQKAKPVEFQASQPQLLEESHAEQDDLFSEGEVSHQ